METTATTTAARGDADARTTAARTSTKAEDHAEHSEPDDAYTTGHGLMANHTLGALLEHLRIQYPDDHEIGEALRGAVDALLDVAIDHQEPRDGVVGYLLPADSPSRSWRYLCRTCAPPELRRIENRVYAESEIATHGTCVRCRHTLHSATAAA